MSFSKEGRKDVRNTSFFKGTWILLFIIPCLIFIWLGVITSVEDSVGLDLFIKNSIEALNQPGLLAAMGIITEAGSVWWFVVATTVFIVILWWLKQGQWIILFFILTVSGGGVLNSLLKHFFERERPATLPQYDATGYSFPSGHAMGSLVFYGSVIYILLKSEVLYRYKLILSSFFIVLIFLVGLSRVYLGVHYTTDVVAGFMAGIVWLMLSIVLLEFFKRMKPK